MAEECTKENPNEKARLHKMVSKEAEYDRIGDVIRVTMVCENCGLEIAYSNRMVIPLD